jgi:ABC-type transporter Mla MlaB component
LAEPSAARPVPSNRPLLELRQRVVVIAGSIEPADVVALCERAHRLLVDVDADPVICEVTALRADLAAVDALARLALTAGRLHHRIRLRHATPDLRELLALAGLGDVVRCEPESGLDPRG